jgi:hypothetical protein
MDVPVHILQVVDCQICKYCFIFCTECSRVDLQIRTIHILKGSGGEYYNYLHYPGTDTSYCTRSLHGEMHVCASLLTTFTNKKL